LDIRKSKRYLFITGAVLATVVLLVWIAVIWGHSMMPGDMSSDESGFVAQIFKPILILLGFDDPSRRTYIVRKVAHFTEYAILAMLSRHFVRARKMGMPQSLIVLAVLLFVTPAIDEFIQSFVPGRSCTLKDVCIDVSGGITGHILYQIGICRDQEKRRRLPLSDA
jgi:VanZ family protein